jgi:hypothetical protein
MNEKWAQAFGYPNYSVSDQGRAVS